MSSFDKKLALDAINSIYGLDNKVKERITNIENALNNANKQLAILKNADGQPAAIGNGIPTEERIVENGLVYLIKYAYKWEVTIPPELEILSKISEEVAAISNLVDSEDSQALATESAVEIIATYNVTIDSLIAQGLEVPPGLLAESFAASNLANHMAWNEYDADNGNWSGISEGNVQWWTDKPLKFVKDPNGIGSDSYLVMQQDENGNWVGMGFTDEATALGYINAFGVSAEGMAETSDANYGQILNTIIGLAGFEEIPADTIDGISGAQSETNGELPLQVIDGVPVAQSETNGELPLQVIDGVPVASTITTNDGVTITKDNKGYIIDEKNANFTVHREKNGSYTITDSKGNVIQNGVNSKGNQIIEMDKDTVKITTLNKDDPGNNDIRSYKVQNGKVQEHHQAPQNTQSQKTQTIKIDGVTITKDKDNYITEQSNANFTVRYKKNGSYTITDSKGNVIQNGVNSKGNQIIEMDKDTVKITTLNKDDPGNNDIRSYKVQNGEVKKHHHIPQNTQSQQQKYGEDYTFDNEEGTFKPSIEIKSENIDVENKAELPEEEAIYDPIAGLWYYQKTDSQGKTTITDTAGNIISLQPKQVLDGETAQKKEGESTFSGGESKF